MKSISAETGTILSNLANVLGIKQSQVVGVVWANDHFTLFYYD